MTYDANYYERGIETEQSLYQNYRWMPDLTLPLAHKLIEHLSIKKTDYVLDFGCAKGFLVKAFHMLDRKRTFGVDISKYAIDNAPQEIHDHVWRHQPWATIPSPDAGTAKYDWIIAKDVLEHIHESQIDAELLTLCNCGRRMFAIVPLGDGNHYHVPAYELDVTHQLKQSLTWWAETFKKNGFTVDNAVCAVEGIKENWSSWRGGNGFFSLTSRRLG